MMSDQKETNKDITIKLNIEEEIKNKSPIKNSKEEIKDKIEEDENNFLKEIQEEEIQEKIEYLIKDSNSINTNISEYTKNSKDLENTLIIVSNQKNDIFKNFGKIHIKIKKLNYTNNKMILI